jgi:hypothetical protein
MRVLRSDSQLSNTEIHCKDQLGISYSTAVGQLKKQIWFRLVKQCGENFCFKCKKEIKTADELSVEHKQPWLHIDPKLFWDVNNLAWSHRKCNRADRIKRKIGPEGTSWCYKCKIFKSIENFYKCKSKWNGLLKWCIECDKRRTRERVKNKKRFNKVYSGP